MVEHQRSGRPKKSLGRKLGIFAVVFLVSMVVGYFILTSGAFVKGFILPRVAKSLNADIQAQDVSLKPFSGITLRALTVRTTGTEPLLAANEVRVRYSLGDIIGGKMTIHEATLVSPTIVVVQNADGTSNLDPLLKRDPSKDDPAGKGSSDPTQVNAQNISIQNGTLRLVQKGTNSTTNLQLADLNLKVDRVANGQSGKLEINSGINVQASTDAVAPATAPATGTLQSTLRGAIDFAFDDKLTPKSAKGEVQIQAQQAGGTFADLAAFNATLNIDVTPAEIRQLALAFSRGGNQLGQVRVRGPFDSDKLEGRLTVELLSLDKNVLELATAGKGLKFGNSMLNSTNSIEIAQNGNFISASGSLNGRGLTVEQDGQRLPELDLNLGYQVNVNRSDENAVLQKLDLTGSQQGKTFLTTTLSRPMNLSWGQTVKGFTESALTVTLTNLNLAQWQAVLPTNAPSGIVGGRINLVAQRDGQLLQTDMALRIADMTLDLSPTNRITGASLGLNANGSIEQMKLVQIDKYEFTLSQGNQRLAGGSGRARYDLGNKRTSLQLALQGALPPLLGMVRAPGLTATSGTIDATLAMDDSGSTKVTGAIALLDFTGRYDTYEFSHYTANVDLNAELQGSSLQIARAAVALKQGANNGGTIDLAGKINLDTKAANLTYKVVNLNEHALAPFLRSTLGTNELRSITLNSSGKADQTADAATALQADFTVQNLVVQQSGTNRIGPLAIGAQLDASLAKEVLDLKRFSLALTPTARATNQLEIKGRLGLNPTNAPPGTISIASTGLDITPYYNLLPKSTNAPTKPAPAADQARVNLEPDAMQLPVQNLTVDLKLDRFYLREVAISNWVSAIKIATNTITVDPFRMSLNGAPLTASIKADVGVPGYRYDVALNIDRAPLDPLAITFMESSPGQYAGNVHADIKIRGAGTQGFSLQKSLQGKVDVSLTNLNLQVVNLERSQKLKRWAVLSETILRQVGVLLQVPDLLQTPVNWVDLDVNMGGGQIHLTNLVVQSTAFVAGARGSIPIQDVLTNSPLDIPMSLALSRSIAEKSRIGNVLDKIAPAGTPTNSTYVPLPQFVRIAGTVGEPKADIDEKRLMRDAAVGVVTRLLPGEGDVGSRLQNLIGGQKQPASTNAPAATTNQPSARDSILRGLGGLLGPRTNAPVGTNNPAGSTNAPAQTNRATNPFDLLRGLQK